MEEILFLSFVTASVSFTVTETKLFLPSREWIKKKNTILGELFFCSYCFAHWIAFALVAVYKPKLFEAWWILDYILTAIVIVWFSSFQMAFLCWLMDRIRR